MTAAGTLDRRAVVETLLRDRGDLLVVSANGYGKRSSAYEYRVTKRGGQGVVNIANTKRNGKVVASFAEDRGPLYAAAFRPDGAQVVVGGFSGTISVYNADTGEMVGEFMPVPISEVETVAAATVTNESTTTSTGN